MSKLHFIIFALFIKVVLFANTNSLTLQNFINAKQQYASIAMGYSSKKYERKYLEQLVYYGQKLGKDTRRYKEALKKLKPIKRKKYTTIKHTNKIKYKKANHKKISKSSVSIQQSQNTLIFSFNRTVNKSDIKFFVRQGKRDYQYIFDIKGRYDQRKKNKKFFLEGLYSVKITQYRFRTIRIILRSKTKVKPIHILQYKKIIVKLSNNKIVNRRVLKHIKAEPKKHNNTIYIKNKTIVIDAGHGGKDSGAIGKRRRYEKTITLKISKYLYRSLKSKGYRVFLTRSNDKYITLRKRTNLANTKSADIFVSIHANAARKSRLNKAKGIETYFLSPARSARAKRVAELENGGDVDSMGWSSKNTFLTVLNQGKITASNKMAIDIQKNMLFKLRHRYGNKTIRDGGVREGPFWVLVGAQMPSILIEVGYISHPTEGKRIYTSTYQKLIAQAIANGIDSYFMKNE